MPECITKIIQNYLTNRIFRVKIENTLSGPKQVSPGVPQGSILGPVLFLIYINDMPVFTDNKIAQFADDSAVYTHSGSWAKL